MRANPVRKGEPVNSSLGRRLAKKRPWRGCGNPCHRKGIVYSWEHKAQFKAVA